jgi:hypothetical protein
MEKAYGMQDRLTTKETLWLLLPIFFTMIQTKVANRLRASHPFSYIELMKL